MLKKSESMESFKKLYQSNRNEKLPVKLKLDDIGYYHQFFKEEKITVKRYMKATKKMKRELEIKIK